MYVCRGVTIAYDNDPVTLHNDAFLVHSLCCYIPAVFCCRAYWYVLHHDWSTIQYDSMLFV